MATSVHKLIFLLFWVSLSITTARALNASSSTKLLDSHLSSLRSVCKSTPYPEVCFDSLKLSISITIGPNILSYLLGSLETAVSEAGKLSGLLSNVGPSNIVEKQRGAVQDCKDLHQVTMSALTKSVSRIISAAGDYRKLADARTFLSAALTNKNTCLEGLDSSTGPMKPALVNGLVAAYKHVSNCLSMVPKEPAALNNRRRRRLMGVRVPPPTWLSRKERRILQSTSSGDEYDLVVAADGTGNFTTVSEAVDFAPNNSDYRTIIYVREGVYAENVEIPSYKPNIVLMGDGGDVTVITGNRSAGDGWTTFRSATVAVSGDGFLARDITFENTAGPANHQAVALRINADLAAIYRCTLDGYQDTLYVHSFRQFYRECDIYGTIDYIFGNAAAVFQASNVVSKMPLPGQFTVITAQSRESPEEDTGISIQNCSIVAADDLASNNGISSSSSVMIKSYLGRPWKAYSRTVYIDSYIDAFIDPAGWAEWPGVQGLDTLYYGEYANEGAGAVTVNRVSWPGYHVMDYNDASSFTVSQFITGDEWLDSTSFPYDDTV